MTTGEKRRLRLGRDGKGQSRLFNFESVNSLLYQDREIGICSSLESDDFKTKNFKRYAFYGQMAELPKLKNKETDLKYNESLPPRRQRLKMDPLPDQHFETFHRRMKREEKNMTGADRSKMMSEIETLKSQLRLLRQHDWMKHLPRITLVKDPKDRSELQRKRELTEKECLRLLNKYYSWEKRNENLENDIRLFNKNMHSDNAHSSKLARGRKDRHNDDDNNDDDDNDEEEDLDDLDDDDEDIFLSDLAALKAKRQERRIEKYGPSIRIVLGNGYDLVGGPFQYPRIEKASTFM